MPPSIRLPEFFTSLPMRIQPTADPLRQRIALSSAVHYSTYRQVPRLPNEHQASRLYLAARVMDMESESFLTWRRVTLLSSRRRGLS